MNFRLHRVPLLVAVCTLRVFAANVGDTYQQVVAEKGQPGAKMEAGDTLVLRYPDEVIRLKAGKVVAIEAAKPRDSTPVRHTSLPEGATREEPAAKPAVPIGEGRLTWVTSYRDALVEAKEKNRRVFAFFTGSDWCGWCIRLNREILSTGEFARYAAENLVLLELDFPRGKPQSADLKRQNESLARRFEVRGFPTVVVLDADGKPVGQLGYQEGGPAPFVKRLRRM